MDEQAKPTEPTFPEDVAAEQSHPCTPGVRQAPARPDVDDECHGRQATWVGRARFLPVSFIALALGIFWYSGLNQHLTFEALAEHRGRLIALVQDYAILIDIAFVLALTAVAALSIPAVAVMNVAAGFLFGTMFGAAYAVIGQTVGAVIIFVAVKVAFRDMVRRVPARVLRQVEAGFARNAFAYMIFLRLAPFLPAWMVNPLPALLGVRLKTFFAATLLGVIPGTLVFSSMGNGLGALIDAGQTPSFGALVRLDILVPLIGLTMLAAIPIVTRHFRKPPSGTSA